eukprot:Amastigsp_a511708_114.p1 type:complete len:226 gc:universal Amastigsp_a511708_114:743-66(-)
MARSVVAFRELAQKVICVGRNYAAHAKELGNKPADKPWFFLKTPGAFIGEGEAIEAPPGAEMHHEIELAVVIGRGGRNIVGTDAAVLDHVGGYALAIDATARNFQMDAKKAGLPWTAAKSQDTFCPITALVPKSAIPDPHNMRLRLSVNGAVRQSGSTADMIFGIPALITAASRMWTLVPGDVILTGTPEGVGPMAAGDRLCGELLSADGRVVVVGNWTVRDRGF